MVWREEGERLCVGERQDNDSSTVNMQHSEHARRRGGESGGFQMPGFGCTT